ncbi:MAG: hypothetical protein EHM28_13125, partial [Spirochaetaceae bacterium]
MGIKKQGFRFLLTGLLLLVLMLAGCPIPETVQENRTYSIEQMLGYLRGQGFSTDDYSLENNRLVIEGDILFNIEDLKAEMYLSDQDSARQSVCINQVRRSKIINIRINTRAPSPSTSIISESWMAALKSAVDAWNNVRNCILNFVLVDSTAKSDTFVCMEANANTGIVAMASGPDWNGNPGTGICINPNWAGGVENLSPSQKYLVMLHEMGHIVGLQHAEFDLTGYGYIPGTPLNDPMSVMNSMVLGS